MKTFYLSFLVLFLAANVFGQVIPVTSISGATARWQQVEDNDTNLDTTKRDLPDLDLAVTAAGTDWDSGYTISAIETHVTGGDASNHALKFPELSTLSVGVPHTIYNDHTLTKTIWPAAADNFVGSGDGVSVSIHPGEFAVIVPLNDDEATLFIARDTVDIAVYTSAGDISAGDMYGKTIFITTAGTYGLPPLESGMNSIVFAEVEGVVLNPDDADLFRLNNTALDAGDSITVGSGLAPAFLVYRSAGVFSVTAQGWTDTD